MIDWNDLIRGVHLAATMLPAGSFIFWFAVARPVSHLAGEVALARLGRRLDYIIWCSLPVILLTGLLWFAAEAVSMSGQPLQQAMSRDVLGTVLNATLFGRLWQVRAALLVLFLGCFLLPGSSALRSLIRDGLGLVLSIALVCSLAWAGHAAAG